MTKTLYELYTIGTVNNIQCEFCFCYFFAITGLPPETLSNQKYLTKYLPVSPLIWGSTVINFCVNVRFLHMHEFFSCRCFFNFTTRLGIFTSLRMPLLSSHMGYLSLFRPDGEEYGQCSQQQGWKRVEGHGGSACTFSAWLSAPSSLLSPWTLHSWRRQRLLWRINCICGNLMGEVIRITMSFLLTFATVLAS